ncbi:MAG: hypothetical protein HY898_17005 [Deltaproteobacteria bacterium]|nr:hypothetical protein [Deltaproteobacteria bacterium]
MSLPLATLVPGGCCVLAAGCCDRPEPNPYEHPLPGRFVEVGLGDSHACARRADGTVICWGVDQQSQVSGKRWMLVRN